MANVSFATGNALAQKLQAKLLWKEAKEIAFFYNTNMIAPGVNSIIQLKDELRKNKGDQITFGLVMNLEGSGVADDGILEGNEESMSFYSDNVTLTQIRNAVRIDGLMTEQRVAFNLREEARDKLKYWLADYMDQKIFDLLAASPTKVFYGGDAISTATIEAGDYFTTDLISKVKAYALTADPKIRPIRIGGKEYFVVVIHPHQAYNLKIDDSKWTQAMREAMLRGKENPLFTGALAMWDGVVVHVSNRLPTTAVWGAGSNIAGATALFLGAQAGCMAQASAPSWVEKKFDYDNQTGFATGLMYGFTKSVFNSKDYSTVAIRTSRTNIS